MPHLFYLNSIIYHHFHPSLLRLSSKFTEIRFQIAVIFPLELDFISWIVWEKLPQPLESSSRFKMHLYMQPAEDTYHIMLAAGDKLDSVLSLEFRISGFRIGLSSHPVFVEPRVWKWIRHSYRSGPGLSGTLLEKFLICQKLGRNGPITALVIGKVLFCGGVWDTS